MRSQIKFLKPLFFFLFCLPSLSNAQFFQCGVLGGIGVGGPKGEALSVKSGISPEIGWMVKYNWTEKVSFRTFLNLEVGKFTFREGRQVTLNYSGTEPTIEDAPDYSINRVAAAQHVDVTYNLVKDKLDISGGVFWGIGFTGSVTPDEPRVFYGATDEEIHAQPDQPSVFQTQFISDSSATELYASDQVQRSFRNLNSGFYAAVTGGTERLKVMVRYDFGVKNFYSKYSNVRGLRESYLNVGVIYFYN